MKLQCHLRQKLLLIQDLFHQPNSRLHEGIWPFRTFTGTGILNILHVSYFLHFEIEQCTRAIALRQPLVYTPRKTNGDQDRHKNQDPMIFRRPEKVFRGIETRIHSSNSFLYLLGPTPEEPLPGSAPEGAGVPSPGLGVPHIPNPSILK